VSYHIFIFLDCILPVYWNRILSSWLYIIYW